MKKKISRKGYRVLAVVWTLAAASMAVAFVRRLAEFNLLLLLLLALSMLTALNFWKAYKRAPELDGSLDPFDAPPRFTGKPEAFDDLPPLGSELFAQDSPGPAGAPNQDSEENDNER